VILEVKLCAYFLKSLNRDLIWGLIPKKAISQFFQIRYHLKALNVLFPMMMKHICVFVVLAIIFRRMYMVLEKQIF